MLQASWARAVDPILRYADVVQPLPADLFTGAVPHGLLDVVAFPVGVQGIQPHQNHVLVLRLELGLTVDGPGQIPVFGAVLDGDDAAGGHLAGAGVALADVHDVLDDLLVGGGHGGAHPVGGVHIGAERIRDCRTRRALPERQWPSTYPRIRPRRSSTLGQVGGMGLVAVAGGVGAAAVGDEHQIILDQVNGLLLDRP